ncbi:Cytochrome c oxidase assembly factor 1 [Lecanosticta acicola]|uniref:Cytochrome c oxidase assembly factor 1 n=1 Tax=Lecanosticta acicola TaxID=111012 RepID=A0AAI8Z8R7_9PEZI|nr:Cytochrome c oxidase assembly factor 1 [Lecanosticta acicola]
MLSRPRFGPLSTLRSLPKQRPNALARRTLIAAPRPGSGPLMQRRPDRALPPLLTPLTSRTWLTTLPLFLLICTASALAIFNYQKTSSSVVASTLYALRTNARARALLGDEVYFASQIPWIHGEMNQLQGRVDVWFWVKGTRGRGVMRFRSERVGGRMGRFETLEWSLEVEGAEGGRISLLEDGDPFAKQDGGQGDGGA